MTDQAKVITGGKVVTPAGLGRQSKIRDGDPLIFDREDAGAIRIRTFAHVVREQQWRFRVMVGPDY